VFIAFSIFSHLEIIFIQELSPKLIHAKKICQLALWRYQQKDKTFKK